MLSLLQHSHATAWTIYLINFQIFYSAASQKTNTKAFVYRHMNMTKKTKKKKVRKNIGSINKISVVVGLISHSCFDVLQVSFQFQKK